MRANSSRGSLRAFATITLDNCLAIRDLKVIEGPRLFIVMPSKKLKEGMYRDIVYPVNAETRKMMEEIVLLEYHRLIGKPVLAPHGQFDPIPAIIG